MQLPQPISWRQWPQRTPAPSYNPSDDIPRKPLPLGDLPQAPMPIHDLSNPVGNTPVDRCVQAIRERIPGNQPMNRRSTVKVEPGSSDEDLSTPTRPKPRKNHICSYCGHASSSRNALEVHIRRHTGERPFACSICGTRCSQQANLNVHMKKHLGIKEHTCSFGCGKKFAARGGLTAHERTHGPRTFYECPIQGCTSSYATPSNLKAHINKVHSELVDELMVRMAANFDELPEEDKHLAIHLATIFKNLGRGIKGRGVGIYVHTINENNNNEEKASSSSPSVSMSAPIKIESSPTVSEARLSLGPTYMPPGLPQPHSSYHYGPSHHTSSQFDTTPTMAVQFFPQQHQRSHYTLPFPQIHFAVADMPSQHSYHTASPVSTVSSHYEEYPGMTPASSPGSSVYSSDFGDRRSGYPPMQQYAHRF